MYTKTTSRQSILVSKLLANNNENIRGERKRASIENSYNNCYYDNLCLCHEMGVVLRNNEDQKG